ncbi:60S ribosomal protein L12 [Colletotrichum simmondsii]|uniref:60S ribosomal protein L12 n=1 Tax=Colletotrichum simmondsii TaxID=703756 RepID=A0A135TZG6_9PEZI|nr:60S ribosomal protein L12 [Colletotrichum simmondsii]
MSEFTNTSDIGLLDNSIANKRQALKKLVAMQSSASDRVKSQRDDIKSIVALKKSVQSIMAKQSNIRMKDSLIEYFARKMREDGATAMDCKVVCDHAIHAASVEVYSTIVISDDSDAEMGSDESDAERDDGAGEGRVRSSTLTDTDDNAEASASSEAADEAHVDSGRGHQPVARTQIRPQRDGHAAVSVAPTASSLIARALEEPPRDREKEAKIRRKRSVPLEEIIEIARTMRRKSSSRTLEGGVKEILGTANSVGCQVDGKSPEAITGAIDAGEIDILGVAG